MGRGQGAYGHVTKMAKPKEEPALQQHLLEPKEGLAPASPEARTGPERPEDPEGPDGSKVRGRDWAGPVSSAAASAPPPTPTRRPPSAQGRSLPPPVAAPPTRTLDPRGGRPAPLQCDRESQRAHSDGDDDDDDMPYSLSTREEGAGWVRSSANPPLPPRDRETQTPDVA